MKKVLLLFDGLNFSEETIAFVRHLHLLSPVLATGFFAPVVSLANVWSYAAAGETSAAIPPLLEEEEEQQMQQHKKRFEELCQASRIPYRVHEAVNDLALPALRHESRFADLLVMSGEAFYNGILFARPSHYLRQALHDTECPVLVLPNKAELPASVLVAYDGSRESVYALKQFAYLFPELARMPTTIVHAAKGSDKAIPEAALIEELAGVHFKNATYQQLAGTNREELRTWMENRHDTLLVAGSFSRNWLSELFRNSFCGDLIQSHRLPVFIAHR
ncbi:adenine nucleotide alpha hydrolase family protein [Flaviaesturariibacter terrae]